MIAKMEDAIRNYRGKPIKIMEVCGTHTYQIARLGIGDLLPEAIRLVSGPGCPVCVTPAGYIDTAAEIVARPGTTLLTFGDMMRVPGNNTRLDSRAKIMYSPMEVIPLAKENPETAFVVAAVGFETTLPVYGLLIQKLIEMNIKNVRLLMAVKSIMPALEWLIQNQPDIQGFIGPGHVSAILGYGVYEKLNMPLAVGGFSYEHIVSAIYDLLRQAERGTREVHNLYPGVVTKSGNETALEIIDTYFETRPSVWRGLGEIPNSGYRLKKAFSAFDAGDYSEQSTEHEGCRCCDVIIGKCLPTECPLFGTACTPECPVGPCMVSMEGSCGIYYETGR